MKNFVLRGVRGEPGDGLVTCARVVWLPCICVYIITRPEVCLSGLSRYLDLSGSLDWQPRVRKLS